MSRPLEMEGDDLQTASQPEAEMHEAAKELRFEYPAHLGAEIIEPRREARETTRSTA